MKQIGYLLLGLFLLAPVYARAQDEGPVTEIETKKLAQTGFKFLSVSLDARAAALGDAITAGGNTTSLALFYNPATMGYFDGMFHFAAGQTRWIADTRYNYASLAYRPAGGAYGVFGLTLVAASYPEAIETIFATNEQGYQELGTFSPSAFAIGIGYARAITDRFSVGGHLRYAKQDLGSAQVTLDGQREKYARGTVSADFGVLYHTALKSFTIAMSVRNFSPEVTYVEESFELPLSFQIGATFDFMDLTAMADQHELWLTVDAVRPRDYPEQLKVGVEYGFMQLLYLRLGYITPTDVQGINAGAGLRLTAGQFRIGVDYAYSSFDVFDSVHRIGLQVGF